MRTKTLLGLSIFFALFLVSSAGKAFAQESNTTSIDTTTNWREEFRSDRQDIQAQKQEMRHSAEQAREEEYSLVQQIEEARQAGDFQKAKDLRDQLHTLHQQNMAERQEDQQAIKESWQEMKGDVKEAMQEGALPPPGAGLVNPPGYNPPGVGPGNPPGYNPPGVGPVGGGLPPVPPAGVRDRREDIRDRREDIKDRREDVRDKREDVRDRREDIADRREDKWDATHNAPKGTEAWRRDKAEDVRDRREDVRDRKEDKLDRREDKMDRKEDIRDRKNNPGVRDHGAGVGAGKGQGGMHRAPQGGPKRK